MSRTATNAWDGLLAREASGVTDQASFSEFVDRHLRFVFRVAYAVVRNTADAEDIAQDTFLKIYRKKAWNGLNDEKGYLARVAWRVCVDRKSAKTLVSNPDNRDVCSPSRNPEVQAMDNQRHERIHRLIDGLPERLRTPLALSAIEGMTAASIAAAMDIPQGTVRRLITEARNLLKEKMVRLEGEQIR